MTRPSITLNVNPHTEVQAQRKRELESKLDDEVVNLELLQTSLKKTDMLTEKMQTILSSFDQRLSKLETFILPIYKSTQKLTKMHTNIDSALAQIEGFTSTLSVIKQHEAIVTKGPQGIPLAVYLESISKLKESLQNLETTKYKSSERKIQALKDTLWKGIRQLDEMFSQKLQAASDAIDPSAYQVDDDVVPSPIPDAQLSELHNLASALAESLIEIGPISAFIKQYEEIRSAHLVKSLASICQTTKDEELKSVHQRGTYQKGSSLLTQYGKNLLILLNTEHALHLKIIPKHHAVTTFAQTIVLSVDGFLDACESMLNRVRRNIQRRDINDVYMLIDVWDDLSNLFGKHVGLLAYCGKKGHDIDLVLANCSATAISYFKEVYDEFRVDSEKKQAALSVDGTVHETTSKTINTLKRLLDFSLAMEHIIMSSQGNPGALPVTSFPEFVSKMIEALVTDLEIKSRGYKKSTLTTLFLLNNFHYILKGLKSCRLVDNLNSDTLDMVEKSIKKQLDVYRSSWMPLIEHLMDTTKISDQRIVTILSKPQREAVKERFKNFNKDFDEMFQTQKAYAIPDVELRAQVIKEVRQVLLPMYNRFYDRYVETEFSKNKEKYIKYDKDALTGALDKFFDASSESMVGRQWGRTQE
ncbi:exocyst complex component exo70 [Batrachochytrium dendrobatidis]|nr:exocyst complex component exo70 [Batrachochytrium dendrobatidis]KAK5672975.1 exocyst complex component exo70 [Batrachochytrium dendrobatidis]